jgi:hypothetical protein
VAISSNDRFNADICLLFDELRVEHREGIPSHVALHVLYTVAANKMTHLGIDGWAPEKLFREVMPRWQPLKSGESLGHTPSLFWLFLPPHRPKLEYPTI